jgi:hypothetical protein
MIALAPRSKNIKMTYDEAVLYCKFLDYDGHIDWRLPTWDEYQTNSGIFGWFLDRKQLSRARWGVTPVRDVC